VAASSLTTCSFVLKLFVVSLPISSANPDASDPCAVAQTPQQASSTNKSDRSFPKKAAIELRADVDVVVLKARFFVLKSLAISTPPRLAPRRDRTARCHASRVTPELLVVLTRAALGLRVVVAALERHPVGLDVLAAGQVIGPGVAGHETFGLPHDVELTVRAHLADQDGLRDVVVRQHLRDATREIRHFDTDD